MSHGFGTYALALATVVSSATPPGPGDELTISGSDSFALSDSGSVSLASSVAGSDSFALSDSGSVSLASSVAGSDSFALSDSGSVWHIFVTGLATGTDGTYVDVTLSAAYDSGSIPAASAFSFSGTSVTVSTPIAQSATVIRVPILGRLLASETITMTYTAGANPIRLASGMNLANFTGSAVTNNSTYELETVIDTLLANGSIADTEYVVGRPISGLAQAGGGGGDGGATQAGTGGAGELRIWSVATAAVGGYTFVCGAAGASGANGTATAGGNATVADVGSTIVTAIGGGPGTGGAVGVAGVGGTGGSGGTGRAGGNGVVGTSSNVAGGATSGTSTAAVTSTPGEPEGNPTRSGSQATPARGVGGSASSTNVGSPGGAGKHTVTYQRAVVASSRPRVSDVAYGRTASTVTSTNVTLPGTHAANDRLMTTVAQEDASGITTMAGWTGVVDQGTAATGVVFVRDSAGGDPVALACSSAKRVNWMVHRLKGAAAVSNITAEQATITAAQANPPSHDHGSSVDALWFACASINPANTQYQTSAFPAGYSARFSLLGALATAAASATLLVASKPLLTTQTEDPGAYTTSANVSGAAWTVCVPK